MVLKQVLVQTTTEETRIAIMEQGRLAEVILHNAQTKQILGNIYLARVVRVLPAMQAAFVDIGEEQNAFLYIDEALPPHWQAEYEQKPNISKLLRQGEQLLVQVMKEGTRTKAPRVTSQISLAGSMLVLLPLGGEHTVSRKIKQAEERNRLKRLIGELATQHEGVIVRTHAANADREQLSTELDYLRKSWAEVQILCQGKKPPSLIYHAADPIVQLIRDLFGEQIDEIVFDSADSYALAKRTATALAPHLLERLKLYRGKQSLFDWYQVEPELRKLLHRQVWLKSGGYLIIDHTEAMTVIDVNTGKFTGKAASQLEQTVTATNLEAAAEIARQLRLRNIGGIIVIDFIDMKDPNNKQRVLETLQRELDKDNETTYVLGLTKLGLVEMTRKKTRQSVAEILTSPCPTCGGKGRILAAQEVAVRLLAEIKGLRASQEIEAAVVELSSALAEWFAQSGADEWSKLANETGVTCYPITKAEFHPAHYQIVYAGSAAEAQRLANAKI